MPATVLDAHGAAVANLRIEDFELTVDGEPKPISDIYRAETPVRMAMLFDNSGSLDASRDFEKRAAMRFFRTVMRPLDQAAIYSVSTTVELSQPMTSDVARLERTIDSFPKPEGAGPQAAISRAAAAIAGVRRRHATQARSWRTELSRPRPVGRKMR